MDTSLPWVAVLDDEAPIRRALLRLMRSVGIPARAFATGAAFLDALPSGAPCCVVLDLHMAQMSGLAVQAALAELAPQVGVIVVTGHHTAELQARVMQLAPLAYLRKPMHDQQLLDAIGLALPMPLPAPLTPQEAA